MDTDRVPSHLLHAQAPGTTSTASHDGHVGTRIPVPEPHDVDSSGGNLHNTDMGQHVYQQKGGGQPSLLLDSVIDAGGCPEVETPFEIDLEDNEALLSLNKELESILDPKNTLRTPPPSIDLSPLECHALQQEEVETLRAIYDQDMSPLNDSGTCFAVQIKFLSEEIRKEDVIKVWFSLPPNYPCVPPVFEIEANQSGSFSYRDADDLFDLLMAESINRVGGTMVFDLIIIAQDYMPGLVERKQRWAAQQLATDQERKKTMELEEIFQSVAKKGIPRELWAVLLEDGDADETFKPPSSMKEPSEEDWEVGGPYGHKHQGVYKPVHFVGPISDVIKRLPEHLQISRIENIVRQDLAVRFDKCRRDMIKALWQKERRFPQMYNLKPEIAFHGTLTKSLPSIVHHGLVIPGTRKEVKVRCGSSLGVGIYLSPDAEVSLGYTDSGRLIVCAALLGRMYKGSYDESKEHYSRFYTFISSCGKEWVIFNASQVLPCYVIQVSSNPNKRQHATYNPPPLASLQDTSHSSKPSSDVQEERERKAKLLARARKFLPYGFGPGSKTVIEDAASFDDDEEDYGDYQTLRYAQEEDDHLTVQAGIVKEKSELQKYRYKDPDTRTESIDDT